MINWVRRKPLYIAYCYHFSSSSQYSICQKINVLALGALLFFLTCNKLRDCRFSAKIYGDFSSQLKCEAQVLVSIYNFAAIGGGCLLDSCRTLAKESDLVQPLCMSPLFWTIVLVALVGLRSPERIQARMQQ